MKHFLAILLLSSLAFAEPFSHDGVFANAAMGLGYASFENADGWMSLTADGLGVKLNGKAGYFVVRDFAVHANLGFVMYSDFRESQLGVSTQVDHDFYVMSSVYLGAGATYYFPEFYNMFVGGSVGFTGYRLNSRKMYGNTGLSAFSFDVDVGREWWVSEHVGLGVSLTFDYAEHWSDNDGVFRSSALMLMFSVSLN